MTREIIRTHGHWILFRMLDKGQRPQPESTEVGKLGWIDRSDFLKWAIEELT